MSGTRVRIDLFFQGMTPAQTNAAFPNFLPAIKAVKAKASVINAGQSNQELTVTAKYHVCYHDETPPKPCEKEIEI